jgi:nitroreductase
MEKPAEVDHEILPLLQNRWSPRAFSDRPVDQAVLLSLLEAARWAPSRQNEQPWAFIIADKADKAAHASFVGLLTGQNPVWAKNAPVLVLTVARVVFGSGQARGKVNRHANYDLGQAVAHLTVQATALGLSIHQMGGFDGEKSRELLQIPEGYDPVTMIAIGFRGNPEDLPDDLRELEMEKRHRTRQVEFVFAGRWEEPFLHASD